MNCGKWESNRLSDWLVFCVRMLEERWSLDHCTATLWPLNTNVTRENNKYSTYYVFLLFILVSVWARVIFSPSWIKSVGLFLFFVVFIIFLWWGGGESFYERGKWDGGSNQTKSLRFTWKVSSSQVWFSKVSIVGGVKTITRCDQWLTNITNVWRWELLTRARTCLQASVFHDSLV